MKEYYFFVNSITTAMKGEAALRAAGFRAYIERDGTINPGGCSYLIKASGQREAMLAVLKKGDVKVTGMKEAT